MGSETGAKWFMMILVYFVFMIFIVTAIEGVTNETIGEINEHTADYCSQPRMFYEEVSDGVIEKTLSTSGELGGRDSWSKSNLECKYSVGILAEDICLQLEGCSWLDDSFWFWETAHYTCRGVFNYTQINETDIETWFAGDYIDYDENILGWGNDDLCAYPTIINNESLCEDLSCSWVESGVLDGLRVIDIKPNTGFLIDIWIMSGDMLTFQFDFGFDNDVINDLLIFLIFTLPLIGMGFSVYVMVRS